MNKLLLWAGIFCLVCAVWPVPFGVFNAGGVTLLITGVLLILLPRYWHKIAAVIPLKRFLAIAFIVGVAYAAVISVFMVQKAYFNAPPQSGEMAVIVLGGGIVDDEPSLMLRRRLNVAYRYMIKNPEAICVVTGGQAPDEAYPESVVMKKYLVSVGIDENRVIIEDKSTNTRENLGFAKTLLPDRDMPSTVVTDGFHQFRSSMYAKEAGLSPPYGMSAVTPWGLFPTYWVREILAISAAFVNIGLGGTI